MVALLLVGAADDEVGAADGATGQVKHCCVSVKLKIASCQGETQLAVVPLSLNLAVL